VRTLAGAVLCTGHTRWREGAVAKTVDPSAHSITLHADLTMTAFYCPVSGAQLAVDYHRADESPVDDLDLTFATSTVA
jgi:N-methylhydantoinase B